MNRRSAIGRMIGAVAGLAAGMLGLNVSSGCDSLPTVANFPPPDFKNGRYVCYRVCTFHAEGCEPKRMIYRNAGDGWFLVSVEC